jgi:hypothetical protein
MKGRTVRKPAESTFRDGGTHELTVKSVDRWKLQRT